MGVKQRGRAVSPTGQSDVEVALLDRAGVIVAVNQAWIDFGERNGADPSRCGPGASYLAACDADAGDPSSRLVAEALRRAVAGEVPAARRFSMPCDPPGLSGSVWFEVLVASRFDDTGACLGAMVTLAPAPPLVVDAASADRSVGGALGIVETLPDGLLVSDAEGRIMLVNRQLELLTGYDRGELLGEPVERLLADEARGRHHALHEQFRAAPTFRGMAPGHEITLVRRDGSLLPVEVNLAPMVLDGWSVTAAAIRDVSALRAADRERRRVLDLLDLVPDAVVVTDVRSLRVIYANQATANLLGYALDDLSGIPARLLRPEADDVERRRFFDALEGGSPTDHDVTPLTIRHRDGTDVPVEAHLRRVREDDGDRVIAVCRDVRALREQERRLRASEESFRTAFDLAPIGMAVLRIDERGGARFLRVNRALADLLHEPAEGLIGRDAGEFTDADELAADRAGVAAMARGERSSMGRTKGYRLRDGTRVWTELRVSVVTLPDLEPVTTLAHFFDITPGYEAEQQRRQRAMAAEVASQVTTAVLAGRPLPQVFEQVVAGIARVFDAENVTVGFPDPVTGHYGVSAGFGPAGRALMNGDVPVSQSFIRRLAAHPRSTFRRPPQDVDPRFRESYGPGTAARFVVDTLGTGVLTVVRPRGAAPFTDAEVDLLETLTSQLAIAVELGRSRAATERLAVLEDRQRIARDLHDTVIQDLIAVGMQLSLRSSREATAAALRAQDADLVDQMEDAVRRLRTVVLQLRDTTAESADVAQTVRAIAREAARPLGHAPDVVISGPVSTVGPRITAEVGAVLREALSNVSRHAEAATTTVTLRLESGELCLVVTDDGRGLPPDVHENTGLANLRHRAADLGGTAVVESVVTGGTRVVWRCPVATAPAEESFDV